MGVATGAMVATGWAVISMVGAGAGSATGATVGVGSGVGVSSFGAGCEVFVGADTGVDGTDVAVADGSAVAAGVELTNI